MTLKLALPSIQRERLAYLRDLLRELVGREMKLRYKRSVLGIAWSLLNPLAQLVVLGVIFGLVLPLNIPNYTIFLFIGLLAWTWFQSSVLAATGAIVDNPDLIKRPGFPVAVLPVVTVTTNLIHFLLALPVLLIFLLISDVQLTAAIVSLPVIIVAQFVFTLGLAYFAATIHVRFRDTQYLLGIVLMLGFYLTPIFYNIEVIPAKYLLLYRLNPMVELIGAYRAVLLYGVWPNWTALALIASLSMGLWTAGYTLFIRTSYQFVEEL